MNDDSNQSAGMVATDAGSGFDHPVRTWRSKVSDGAQAIEEAIGVLGYSTRQEVEAARIILGEALDHLAEACEIGEGKRSG